MNDKYIIYLNDPNKSGLHHQDPLSENGDVMGEFRHLSSHEAEACSCTQM